MSSPDKTTGSLFSALYRFRWIALPVLVVTVFCIDVFRMYWLFPVFVGAVVVVTASLDVERRRRV